MCTNAYMLCLHCKHFCWDYALAFLQPCDTHEHYISFENINNEVLHDLQLTKVFVQTKILYYLKRTLLSIIIF